jgi:hypothetical protein
MRTTTTTTTTTIITATVPASGDTAEVHPWQVSTACTITCRTAAAAAAGEHHDARLHSRL